MRSLLRTLCRESRLTAKAAFKDAGSAGLAVLLIALGIGATACVFAVIYSVLLRPLPYGNSTELVWVWSVHQDGEQRVSYPDFLDWRSRTQSMELVGWGGYESVLTGVGEPERLQAAFFLGDLFDVLEVPPLLGQTERDRLASSDGPPQAVLSYNLWRRSFAADPDIIGQQILLDDVGYTVGAVMPAGFEFPIGAKPRVDLWIPLQKFNPALARSRSARVIEVIGRLKDGVSLQNAQAELDVVTSALAARYPATNEGYRALVIPALQELTGTISQTLWIVFAAVGMLLIITCVNVAGLLLVRIVKRRPEMALRAALGAGRGRLALIPIVEGLVLSLIGGAIGCAFAFFGVEMLSAIIPADLPRAGEIRLDFGVCLGAIAAAGAAGVLCGLVPTWNSRDLNPGLTLKEGSPTLSGGTTASRSRSVLVVAEISLAVVLLSSAIQLATTYLALNRFDPALDPDKVLTFSLNWHGSRSDLAFEELRQRLLAIPGVAAASTGLELPSRSGVTLSDTAPYVEIAGAPPGSYQHLRASLLTIQPGFFRAMGTRILEGRDFLEREGQDSPRTAIINESLARRYFPGENPIGKHITLESWTLLGEKTQEIVGVVADIKPLAAGFVDPVVYLPLGDKSPQPSYVTLRADSEPLALIPAIRSVVRSLNDREPIYDIQTLAHRISASVERERFMTFSIGVFSVIAMILTSVGIYGALSSAVVQRTREIAIRRALGATEPDIVRLILRHGTTLVLMGLVLGLTGVTMSSIVLENRLFGVAATDPAVLAGTLVLALTVGLIACWTPARAASRVDPMTTMRT